MVLKLHLNTSNVTVNLTSLIHVLYFHYLNTSNVTVNRIPKYTK